MNKDEQISFFGKVIEFPKNREYEQIQRNKKLDSIQYILDLVIQEGYDFSIVIEKEIADKILSLEDGSEIEDILVISTDKELNKKILRGDKTYSVINGNEFDEFD